MFVQVAIDCPLFHLFDYRLPAQMESDRLIGSRVLVPFGRRTAVGVVFNISTSSDLNSTQLKSVTTVLDSAPVFDHKTLKLLQWAAQYYLHPIGKVTANALPPELRKAKPIPRRKPLRHWQVAVDRDPADLKRAPKQLAIFQWMMQQNATCSDLDLYQQFGSCSQLIQALCEKGYITAAKAKLPPTDHYARSSELELSLNPEQQAAYLEIEQHLAHYRCFLLDGITGSGKTEVYVTVIKKLLSQDRQTLLLVPEIGLTPQLQQRLQRALGVEVGMLHSGQSSGDRIHTWLAASSGSLAVLIGTRLSVFTPMPRLGLIVVDEEHDSAYKQHDGFLYNARDVAIYRAHRESIPIVLGSATPSFESLHNVQTGRYHVLKLTQRAGDARLPSSTLIDLRAIQAINGLSPPVIRSIRTHLDDDRQVMLFLNRRGYAPTLLCTECGWIAECTRCDARMTVHKQKALLICHHCDRQIPLPEHCPECAHTELLQLGEGTQKIEQVLEEQFPSTPLIRLDRDSTRKKHAFEEAFQSIRKGGGQIILGTQMIAKGHDFPNLTLVVVIDLDYGFFSTDYRALERTAQLLVQVAGRAGRRDKPGEVLIQSHFPEHPYMQSLLYDGYHSFAKLALQERAAAKLPPYRFHIALRARAQNSNDVYAFLQSALKFTRSKSKQISAFGPIPSAMERKAGYVRAYVLFAAEQRAQFKQPITRLVENLATFPLAKKVQWALDVDPLDSE